MLLNRRPSQPRSLACIALSWLAATLALALLQSHAQAQTASVFPLGGEATVEQKQRVALLIQNELEALGRTVRLESESIETLALVLGCSLESSDCVQTIALELKVSEIVFGILQAQESYTLSLHWLTSGGEQLAEQTDPLTSSEQSIDSDIRTFFAPETPARNLRRSEPQGLVEPPAPGAGELVAQAPPAAKESFFERAGALPVLLTATGVVLTVVGIGLGASAKSVSDDINARAELIGMPPTAADLSELQALGLLVESGQSKAQWGYAAMATGGVAVLTGSIWGLIAAGSDDEDAE